MFYVFGDSHSEMWRGTSEHGQTLKSTFPGVDVQYLGPALAWNLLDETGAAPGKWGQHIVDTLDAASDITGVLLVFGEIDMRCRVVANAAGQDITLQQAAQNIAQRLLDMARIIAARFNGPVFIYEPGPTMMIGSQSNVDFPTTGSDVERNAATTFCNQFLRQSCADIRRESGLKIYSFGAHAEMVNFGETDIGYLKDTIHLNMRGFKKVLDRFKELCLREGLHDAAAAFDVHAPLFDKPMPVDLTSVAHVRCTNPVQPYSRLTPLPGQLVALRTEPAPKNEVNITLRAIFPLFAIDLWSPEDVDPETFKGLHLEIGTQPNRLTHVPVISGNPDSDEYFLRIFLKGQEAAQHLRLSRDDGHALVFGRVRIVGLSCDRRYPELDPADVMMHPRHRSRLPPV